MNFKIRPYSSEDYQRVVELMGLFNAFIASIDDQHRTAYKQGSSEYFTDKMIQLCETKNGSIFVMLDDKEIIGFVSGHVSEQDDDEKMESLPAIPGIVGELFVLKEYQGKGCGKSLLLAIEDDLRNKGCTLIRFPVFWPNISARKFYSKLGYKERMLYVNKDL